jgi:Cu/Ag efflux pump CusA
MADAQKMISEKLPMPNGYTLARSGQCEIIQQNSTRSKVAGLIALAGLEAEIGSVMLLYLDKSDEGFKAAGRMNTDHDLRL